MPDPLIDPFRLRVLKAVCQVIKGVTPANGYRNDLSDFTDADGIHERVFRGRDLFGFGDPRPMVSVLEHPQALELATSAGAGGSTAGDWMLIVQGFVQDDPDHPTDPGHILVAEVIKALALQRTAAKKYNLLGLGGRDPCVTNFKIGSPVVRPGDGEISDVCHFVFKLTLTLSEDHENPFA